MKSIILILMLVAGCKELPTKPTEPAPVTPKAPPQMMALAWGPWHSDWDKWLTDAVNASAIKPDLVKPCKNLSSKDCLIQALSIMAKYESGFKPAESYAEGFNDAKGDKVISRGLLQISIESANQSQYSCGIKTASELHDPKINIICAVKIAVYQINRDGTFFGGDKLGLGRYWSVARKSSSSYYKIQKYLDVF